MTSARSFALMLALMLVGVFAPEAMAQQAADHSAVLDVGLSAGRRDSLIESSTCADGGQRVYGGGLRLHRRHAFGVSAEVAHAQRCDRPAFTFYQPETIVLVQAIRDIGPGARVRPYVIVGAGLVTHRQLQPSSRFPRVRGLLAAGGGVRLSLEGRMSVSPELQLGHDGNYFNRFVVWVGYRLR
ncbi:MAG: hypothetical protein IT184_02805 [Acidobacteria bacterium]|nr:hypothetical protein [Acidobacteriota bacterium]